MKKNHRALLTLLIIAAAIAFPGDTGLRATGNLEVITQGGTAIGVRVWNANSLPIVWKYHDPTTFAACNYSSANAPAVTLQAANAAGFNTWQNDLDSKISFAYGGTTTTRSVGTDGINVVTFCDAGVLAGNLGFVASTPSTALTVQMTVTSGGGCPSGQGLLDTNGPPPPAGFCFPVGTYPPGTIVDADIRYNTFGTSEASFSTNNTTAGSLDIQSVATHEEGHFFGLSHDPIHDAVMFPFVDDIPYSDGLGQRILKRSDLTSSEHYYPEASYGTSFGSITGRITLDGIAADGVHVVAVDPVTLKGVAGRFSISRFEDPAAIAGEGPDFATQGAAFYRIDGLPPGNYYVYTEYFDNSEFVSTRLLNRYNTTIGNSNVSDGNTGSAGQVAGWLGFLPQLPEFWNLGESSNGGDGVAPGTATDNSDVASLVHVTAGAVTSGIDVAINIEPVNGQTPAQRQNPTARVTLPNDNFQGTDRITGFLLNGGTDDFYAVQFPASLLPAPPYNVAEGLWARGGRNLSPYVNRLVLTSPSNPALPALNDPIVASAGRVLTGGPSGATAAADLIDVRDQWNVTINEPRDVWVILNQPASPAGTALITQGFFVLVGRTTANTARVGRTLLTQNGGATWGTLTADVFYDLLTETAPPVMINSASPAFFEEGQRGNVDIIGSGFELGATVDFGAGVTVNSVTFIDSHTLQANIKVTTSGAVADRPVNVQVTNPSAVFPNVSRVFTIKPSTNVLPIAVSAAAPNPAECTSPAGAFVTLDGTGSTDGDSSAGTNDDIVSFEWFEDFGLPSQTALGTGQTLGVQLSLGTHAITLRVTDTHDEVDTDTISVVVEDTTAPVITLSIDPQTLWPPNHSMVGVTATVTASDICSGVTLNLFSVTSSEPDDAQGGGDGSTVNDIQNASLGTADSMFGLRAERLGAGVGRVYTVTYTGTDGSGNTASATTGVTVPHSQNGIVEPLVLSVTETASGTLVEWEPVAGALYYNIIRGQISNLRDTGVVYDLGPVRCVDAVTQSLNTAGKEDGQLPAPGEAFFYLAEYHDGWNRSYGTEEIARPHRPGQGSCQ